jgi:hypothetical protein
MGEIVHACPCIAAERERDALRAELVRVETERDRYREALEFYANPESWYEDDWGLPAFIQQPDYGKPGQTARSALAGLSKEDTPT